MYTLLKNERFEYILIIYYDLLSVMIEQKNYIRRIKTQKF